MHRILTARCAQDTHSKMCTGYSQQDVHRILTARCAQDTHSKMCTGYSQQDVHRILTARCAQDTHSKMCTGYSQQDVHRILTARCAQDTHSKMCTGYSQPTSKERYLGPGLHLRGGGIFAPLDFHNVDTLYTPHPPMFQKLKLLSLATLPVCNTGLLLLL